MATRERFCRCGKPLEQSQTVEGKPARWPKYCSDACRQAAYREDSPTTVYRLFDADGSLLYVGCTNGVKARFKTHQATKEWWTEVVLVDLEHYPNRQQAMAVEAERIRCERPKYNVVTPVDVDSSPQGIRLVRIMIQLESETIEQVDKIRGAVPRAAWVRLLIEDQLAFAERAKKYRADPELAKLTVAAIEEMDQGLERPEKAVRQLRGGVPVQKTTYEWDGSQSVPVDRTIINLGKGSPATQGSSEEGSSTQIVGGQQKAKSPSRKPKACKHTNQIRKLGAAFCTDCGEFV